MNKLEANYLVDKNHESKLYKHGVLRASNKSWYYHVTANGMYFDNQLINLGLVLLHIFAELCDLKAGMESSELQWVTVLLMGRAVT